MTFFSLIADDEVVELHMSDQDHLSEFSASIVRKGERGVKLLGVEYHTVQQDMFVEVEGEDCTLVSTVCS